MVFEEMVVVMLEIRVAFYSSVSCLSNSVFFFPMVSIPREVPNVGQQL